MQVLLHPKLLYLKSEYAEVLKYILLDKDMIATFVKRTSNFKEYRKYENMMYLFFILHDKNFPEELKTQLDTKPMFTFEGSVERINSNKHEKVIYQYMLDYHVNKLNKLDDEPYNANIKKQVLHHVRFVLDFLNYFNKSRTDIPEVVKKFIQIEWEEFCYYEILHDDENGFMLRLKTDANTLKQFQDVKNSICNLRDPTTMKSTFNMTRILRMLKIYFSHDIAKDFVKFFDECLSEKPAYDDLIYCIADAAVSGLFILADDNYKMGMMLKYAPKDVTPNRTRDEFQYAIQEAICNFVHYSRPPIPLSYLKPYMEKMPKVCEKTITKLFTDLPRPMCVEFTKQLLTKQKCCHKYGLGTAFHSLDIEDIKSMVINVWRSTNSKEVRKALYVLIYDKIRAGDESIQIELLAVFKELTSDLRESDHKEIFSILKHGVFIPRVVRGDLFAAAWECIKNFENSPKFKNIKNVILCSIDDNISLMNKEFLKSMINDHIQNMLERNIFTNRMWNIAASYLLYYADSDDTNQTLTMVNAIIAKCDGKNTSMDELRIFVKKLAKKSIALKREKHSDVNVLLEHLLSCLLHVTSFENDSMMLWRLKLAIISNNVVDCMYSTLLDDSRDKCLEEIQGYFGVTHLKFKDGCSEKDLKHVMFNFTKEVDEAMQDLIKKNQYNGTFVHHIASVITCIIEQIRHNVLKQPDFNIHYFDLTLCFVEGLVNLEQAETHLLALHILQKSDLTSLGPHEENFKAVFVRIRAMEDNQVQQFLHWNFQENGESIKRRRL